MLVVDGFNISSAVRATDSDLSGVKLRNVQVCQPATSDDYNLTFRLMGIEMGRIYILEEEPISNSEDPILINWWNTFDRMIRGMSFQVRSRDMS
jgi:hypothetical protein